MAMQAILRQQLKPVNTALITWAGTCRQGSSRPDELD